MPEVEWAKNAKKKKPARAPDTQERREKERLQKAQKAQKTQKMQKPEQEEPVMDQPGLTAEQMEQLRRVAGELGVLLDTQALERFSLYCAMLLSWNQKINLTAVRTPEGVLTRHFEDSLTLLKACGQAFPLGKETKIIDVGTGAGFPGVPLAIARPDVSLTLLDSLQKRLTFLQALLQRLQLHAQLLHLRAEEGGILPQLRESFDIAVSRAVAPLNLLAEYCLPYVQVGGLLVAMKGPDVAQECDEAQEAFRVLGGELEQVVPLTLSDGSGRSLVLIRKKAATPKGYPRHGSKIAKRPL